MSDKAIRATIEQHWLASERGDIAAEHAMYAEQAVLDYPQPGERFRGRETIAAQRGEHPGRLLTRPSTSPMRSMLPNRAGRWPSECRRFDGMQT